MNEDEKQAWKKVVLAQHRDELNKIIRQNLPEELEKQAIDRLLFQKRPDIFPPVNSKPEKFIPKPRDPSAPKQFRPITAEQIPYLSKPLSPSGGYSYKDLFKQVLMPTFTKDLQTPERRKTGFENTDEARALRARSAELDDAVRRAKSGFKYNDSKLEALKEVSNRLSTKKIPTMEPDKVVNKTLLQWLTKNPKYLGAGALGLGVLGAGIYQSRKEK